MNKLINLKDRRNYTFGTINKVSTLLRYMMPEGHEVSADWTEYESVIVISARVYTKDTEGKSQSVLSTSVYVNHNESGRIVEAKCLDFVDETRAEAEKYVDIYNDKLEQEDNQPEQEDNQPEQ